MAAKKNPELRRGDLMYLQAATICSRLFLASAKSASLKTMITDNFPEIRKMRVHQESLREEASAYLDVEFI
jgi:hypothetical protein